MSFHLSLSCGRAISVVLVSLRWQSWAKWVGDTGRYILAPYKEEFSNRPLPRQRAFLSQVFEQKQQVTILVNCIVKRRPGWVGADISFQLRDSRVLCVKFHYLSPAFKGRGDPGLCAAPIGPGFLEQSQCWPAVSWQLLRIPTFTVQGSQLEQ